MLKQLRRELIEGSRSLNGKPKPARWVMGSAREGITAFNVDWGDAGSGTGWQ